MINLNGIKAQKQFKTWLFSELGIHADVAQKIIRYLVAPMQSEDIDSCLVKQSNKIKIKKMPTQYNSEGTWVRKPRGYDDSDGVCV